MARRRVKKRRAPEILWRLFGDRARPLGDAVLSLLPPSPPSPQQCRCRGRRCLACSREDFLICADDPPEFRRLINHAFCVISPAAPPPPVVFVCSGVSQRIIVENTIELMKGSEDTMNNVIYGQQAERRSSRPNAQYLCSQAWDLLLSRIGDALMVFLLRYALLFLPLPYKSYHQVAGPPVDKLLQCPQSFACGMKRKRKHYEQRSKNYVHRKLYSSNSYKISLKGDKFFRDCGIMEMNTDDIRLCKTIAANPVNSKDKEVLEVNLEKESDSSIIDRKKKNVFGVMSWPSALRCSEPLCIPNQHLESHIDAETDGNLSFQKLLEMHSVHMSPSSQKKSSVSEPCSSLISNESLQSSVVFGSRKRVRLYSWQRRKRLKNVRSQGASIFCSSSPSQNMEPSVSPVACVQSKELYQAEESSHLARNPGSDSTRRENKHGKEFFGDDNDTTSPLHTQEAPWLEKVETKEVDKVRVTLQLVEARSLLNQIAIHNTEKVSSWCLYCFMCQYPPEVSMGTQIRRQHSFYSTSPQYSGFPKNHILNSLKPNDSGAVSFMKHIFSVPGSFINFHLPCTDSCRASPIRSRCLYHSFLGLLKSFIRNAKRCQYRKLLFRHCTFPNFRDHRSDDCHSDSASTVVESKFPIISMCLKDKSLPSDEYGKPCKIQNAKEPKEQLGAEASVIYDQELGLVDAFSRPYQVVSFIWAVIRRIVPPDLLGDSSTRRALRKNIAKFVGLRRFEKFCLRQSIHGLKTSSFSFLWKLDGSNCTCLSKIEHDLEISQNLWKVLRQSSQIKQIVSYRFLSNWIYWLFTYVVVPLIRNNFYVTERESKKQELYYYAKPVWNKLVANTVDLKEQKYRPIDHASLRHLLSKRSFGYSKVRYLPKRRTLRFLANLKAPCKIWFVGSKLASKASFPNQDNSFEFQLSRHVKSKRKLVWYKSVNSALREIHAVMRKIKAEDPEKLGCSVFDYNDVYQKLLLFVSKLKEASFFMPKLFIVVADVSKAFDSIDQTILLDIMKDVMGSEDRVFRNYAKVVCTKNSMRTLYDYVPIYEGRMSYDISKSGSSVCLFSSNSIIIDQGKNKKLTKGQLQSLLREHITHNILQIGQKFYLQKVGISQGSILSSLLCSFYYGHLERHTILPYLSKVCKDPHVKCKDSLVTNRYADAVCRPDQTDYATNKITSVSNYLEYLSNLRFGELAKEISFISDQNHVAFEPEASNPKVDSISKKSQAPNYLLVRLIDDFLFITTSENQACSFFNRMRRGFREYNCFMNDEKYGYNFNVEGNIPNRIYKGADGISFLPWSGLLLNCSSLEVQADYTRYWGVHMRDTLTVEMQGRPSYHLGQKLCNYLRPKCHPIFYDSNINSSATIRLNMYQAFLLCAMKFHCYVCSIQDVSNLSANFFLTTIQMSFSYFYRLIKKLMHDMALCLMIRPVLRLSKSEVFWLGTFAYIRALKKKQSRHKELLSLLRSEILALGGIDGVSPDLRYAVNDSHSSCFWQIIY